MCMNVYMCMYIYTCIFVEQRHSAEPAVDLALGSHLHTHTSDIYVPRRVSRRREHLHAKALQIRAELSTLIHRETGPQRPTHSFWSFLIRKQNWSAAKSHRLFASARRTTLYAMPPAAGQPATLQGTEPGQGHLRGRRAECACETESELESVLCLTKLKKIGETHSNTQNINRLRSVS